MKKLLLLILAIAWCHLVYSQDRFAVLENKLQQIATQTPGLTETVDFSVVGVSIQEFLRGLAETNNLNISIDPSLDIRVYNNFTNEKVSNILLFLCREYSLDIDFVGSIMSFKKFETPAPPEPKLVAKKIDLRYDAVNKTITLNLQNDSIQRVVKEITTLTNNNLVLSPEIKPDKKISVYIQNMPFESAIQKMAFANGLEMEKTDDNFFVLREVPAEVIANNATSSRSTNRSGGNSSSRNNRQGGGGSFVQIVDSAGTQYLSFDTENSPISDAIKQVSQELNQNYFLFSEPTGNTTAHLSKVTYDEFLNYILQGSKHTYKVEDNIYLIGERSLEGLRKTKVVRLQYRSFQDVMAVIPSELKTGVQISEFKDLNSFILSGSAPQIQEIEAFVYEIDKVVPLVMIEVIMVDINRDHKVTTGIKAGLKDNAPNTSNGTFNDGSDSGDDGLKYILSSATINTLTAPLNLGKVSQRFYMQLSAMESNRNAQIRSMPKLATLNGHEATLSIGTKRNYVIENANIIGSLTPTTTVTRTVNSAEANLEINITPVVSGDDHVTLNITVSNSDFITEPQNNLPPDTRNSTFTSLIRVRDNDMVLLGGMERINKSEAGTGVPLLSRIPIIKWFFSSRSKSRSKSISVVFIKPSIIY